jgi:hypothetical protein
MPLEDFNAIKNILAFFFKYDKYRRNIPIREFHISIPDFMGKVERERYFEWEYMPAYCHDLKLIINSYLGSDGRRVITGTKVNINFYSNQNKNRTIKNLFR